MVSDCGVCGILTYEQLFDKESDDEKIRSCYNPKRHFCRLTRGNYWYRFKVKFLCVSGIA